MPEAKTFPRFKRNLALLSGCWAVVAITNMLVVSASALVGNLIAEDKTLVTLPIAMQWLGVSIFTVPASFLMSRVGRRNGFIVAALVLMVGAGICVLAIYQRSFPLYLLGSFLLGTGNGFSWYYRFAAAEIVPEDWKSRAISLTLAGGVISAVFAPPLADLGKDLLAPVIFAGTFAIVAATQIVVIGILALIEIPKPPRMSFRGGRPIGQIARQPKFVVAVVGAVVAYGTMVMLMSVTPLAMDMCGLSFQQATSAIQWHILGMYVPAFFTGHLIKRYGVYPMMTVGALFNIACVSIALSGQTYWHFLIAQLMLGVGWNFLYVGATTLLTETYTLQERAKTQAFNELLVFVVTGTGIFLSGKLLTGIGWNAVNIAVMPLIGAVLLGVLWLWLGARRARPA